MKVCQNTLQLIGNTPLLQLTHIITNRCASVFVKLEMFNLTGSVKDRPALGMIKSAEQAGVLQKGATIVESTSGNLGVSLAAIAAYKKYKVICVIDPKIEITTLNAMKAYGAQIVMVDTPDDQGGYQKPRIAKVQKLLQQIPNAVNLDQYNNPNNPNCHFLSTGPEILRDMDGDVDILIGSVSTGGTLCGTARYLKRRIKNIWVIGVEPCGSVLFGGHFTPYLQQGTGLSFIPGNYDPVIIDQKVKVTDADAFRTSRALARMEGILVGGSAGAVVFTALQIARQQKMRTNIVAILPDRGDRYLLTLYSEEWMRDHKLTL